MGAYPKTYSVRITRHGDNEVFVTYNDSTGRYESGRRIARGTDVSDLPRYVRDELSEWKWAGRNPIESTTTEGHPGSRHAEHMAGEHAEDMDMDCAACKAEWADIVGGRQCEYESSEPGTLLCVLPMAHAGPHETPRYAFQYTVQS